MGARRLMRDFLGGRASSEPLQDRREVDRPKGVESRGLSQVSFAVHSRYYKVDGETWEARFFHKWDRFPESDFVAPRQGVWAKPKSAHWDEAVYVAECWRFVDMDPDVLYLPERKAKQPRLRRVF